MRRLFAPVDIAALIAFRVIFGVLMLVAVGRYFAHGWIAEFFLAPRIFFPYAGFEWVAPWPGWGMYAHYVVLGAAALGVLLGAWYRLSIIVFFLAFTYAQLIDKSLYLNHYYLVSLISFLMILMPLGRAGSIDAWRRPALAYATVPAWMVWILSFQLAVVYVFSGIAKINGDWLLRAQPLRIWLAARTDTPLLGPWFDQAWVAYAMSWSGMLFDLTIVGFLLWRRARPWAYLVVIVFHVLTSVLFPPIGLFPWIMIGLTTIFFPPDWPRRLWRAVTVAAAAPATMAPIGTTASASSRALVGAFVVTYVVIQLAVPLRAFRVDGPVCWSEDGFRFSWRVMLMQKDAHAEFTVIDPEQGTSWRIDPRTYLTPLQAGMMSTQPDMIRWFARWLADAWRQEGHDHVEVRAEVRASLNGRPQQLLIDPAIDIASASAAPITMPAPR